MFPSPCLFMKSTQEENKRTSVEEDTGNATAVAAQESVAAKQMATLVDLMRQQMEWNMRSESGRREQDLGSAEALETRMRGMEVILRSPFNVCCPTTILL